MFPTIKERSFGPVVFPAFENRHSEPGGYIRRAPEADDHQTSVFSGDLKWGPAPPALPKGAEITVLSGDPSKDGPYVLRLKMPSGYKVPAHNHPSTENLTVVSGNFHIGMGDKLPTSETGRLSDADPAFMCRCSSLNAARAALAKFLFRCIVPSLKVLNEYFCRTQNMVAAKRFLCVPKT
jgi:hypothetical protein